MKVVVRPTNDTRFEQFTRERDNLCLDYLKMSTRSFHPTPLIVSSLIRKCGQSRQLVNREKMLTRTVCSSRVRSNGLYTRESLHLSEVTTVQDGSCLVSIPVPINLRLNGKYMTFRMPVNDQLGHRNITPK